MRFIVCARDREYGTMSLVSGSAFPNRREAVEAVIASPGIDALLRSDVFLIDLEAATPIALIPVEEGVPVTAGVADEAEPVEGAQEEVPEAESPRVADDEAAPTETASEPSGVRLLEIDIESWTCEDCIYVLTCAKSGTTRPAECGSFQWRA